MAQDSLRQVEPFHLIFNSQLYQFRCVSPESSYIRSDQSLVGQVVQSPAIIVSNATGVDHCQIARRTTINKVFSNCPEYFIRHRVPGTGTPHGNR